MYTRTNEQAWSVRAEFTISHPGAGDPENVPKTNTDRPDDNSVRMTYSWDSRPERHQQEPRAWSVPTNLKSDTPSYTFQKGNLSFSSTPPLRRPRDFPARSNLPESSGYGSDLLSPNSLTSSNLQHHSGRKCRSTCNITLSTVCENEEDHCHHHECGRTHSLRCQTPQYRSDKKEKYYGCGDPWCHHLQSSEDFSNANRFSPVVEESHSSTLKNPLDDDATTMGFCDRSSTRSLSRDLFNVKDLKKDVSVQTFEMVDKCTSPFLKIDTEREVRRKKKSRSRRRSSSYHRSTDRGSPTPSFTPNSLESARIRPSRRLTRSPKLRQIPQIHESKENSDTAKSSDNSKKPRTVHIDVYCTGTELETDSSDSSNNATTSTPQTVFESERVKITHKRADIEDFPINYAGKFGIIGDRRQFPKKDVDTKNNSDSEDASSMAYPSKLSSFSTVPDLSSSISSVPWTNYSMSSCALPFGYDSNTSWKDNTYSDLDSLLQSRSSITGTESLLFVPRKTNVPFPIQEETSSLNKLSVSSLQASDSFEYADSLDKLRIRQMEEMWQQKKSQDDNAGQVITKKLKSVVSKDSESESESEGEWTFVKTVSNTIERNDIIRKNKDKQQNINSQETQTKSRVQEIKDLLSKNPENTETNKFIRKLSIDHGSLSDSSPSPSCRTPSSIMLFQKLRLDPNLNSPFTIAPGMYTEPRTIAKKFGGVVNAFKKPGHHVGPVKNPQCECEHCRSYFEGRGTSPGFRGRTRSVGDSPSRLFNWRKQND